MTIAEINALEFEDFVSLFGGIYEHSSWIAEHVWHERPFESRGALRALMQLELDTADHQEQITLLRAQPDLDALAKVESGATREKGAGLDQLTPDEYKNLMDLTRQYREKFGFPFILAVRGRDKHDIERALAHRLEASPEEEFRTAIAEVQRIAAFRLDDIVE